LREAGATLVDVTVILTPAAKGLQDYRGEWMAEEQPWRREIMFAIRQ
jgi:hypothetical protein